MGRSVQQSEQVVDEWELSPVNVIGMTLRL